MADPSTYRPAPGEIPTSPGVYRFLDGQGRVIYVGKAKNLRQRLSNYFQDLAALHPRTQKMVTTACAVEWTVVSTEVESLALEYSWIKEFNPRFNVMYKDDKSYPYLAVTMGETYPRVQVVRGARKPGTRYFGPFVQAWSIRETVEQLLRVFPVRSCSAGVFRRAQASGRPCLLGYIDKCSAPCVGRISPQDHRALAEDFCAFMAGRTGPYLRQVEAEMKAAAAALDFEKAARLRDDAGALRQAAREKPGERPAQYLRRAWLLGERLGLTQALEQARAALALALIWRPGRAAYALAAASVIGLTLTATALLPALWLHPIGPLSKNLPILAILAVLWRRAP